MRRIDSVGKCGDPIDDGLARRWAFAQRRGQIDDLGSQLDSLSELLQDAAQFLLHDTVARDGLAPAGERDLGEDSVDPRCHVRNDHVKTVGFVLFDDLRQVPAASDRTGTRSRSACRSPPACRWPGDTVGAFGLSTRQCYILGTNNLGGNPPPAPTHLTVCAGRAVIAVVSHLCETVGWVVSRIGPASVL
jgi:hypothetical protein